MADWHARLHTAKQLCDIQHASQLADSRSQHSKQDKAQAQAVLTETSIPAGLDALQCSGSLPGPQHRMLCLLTEPVSTPMVQKTVA